MAKQLFIDQRHMKKMEPTYIPYVPPRQSRGGGAALLLLIFAGLAALAVACSGCCYFGEHDRRYDRYGDCWQNAPVHTVNEARS